VVIIIEVVLRVGVIQVGAVGVIQEVQGHHLQVGVIQEVVLLGQVAEEDKKKGRVILPLILLIS